MSDAGRWRRERGERLSAVAAAALRLQPWWQLSAVAAAGATFAAFVAITLAVAACGVTFAATTPPLSFLTRLPLSILGRPSGMICTTAPTRHLRIKLGDVLRFHADAAVTCGTADLFFLRRSMNINTALKGVRVLRLEATQPDDARDDRDRGQERWAEEFHPLTAGYETPPRPARCHRFFLRPARITERSGHASPRVAQAEH